MITPEDVLGYWLDELKPADWYVASDAVDAEITKRFLPAWQEAMDGGLGLWLTYPSGALAYVILTDQFSRNMFRGQAKAFASDLNARAVAKAAINRDWDLKIDHPARQFFYLPLEHSENIEDQDRAVRLIKTRVTDEGSGLLHAQAHREIIRKFGRFPFRNAALGRRNTGPEEAFLVGGAYGSVVRDLQRSREFA